VLVGHHAADPPERSLGQGSRFVAVIHVLGAARDEPEAWRAHVSGVGERLHQVERARAPEALRRLEAGHAVIAYHRRVKAPEMDDASQVGAGVRQKRCEVVAAVGTHVEQVLGRGREGGARKNQNRRGALMPQRRRQTFSDAAAIGEHQPPAVHRRRRDGLRHGRELRH
jgi:hypothetical protein